MRPVPVDAQRADWPRLVANAINALIAYVSQPQAEQVRYHEGALEYWDGSAWQPVP